MPSLNIAYVSNKEFYKFMNEQYNNILDYPGFKSHYVEKMLSYINTRSIYKFDKNDKSFKKLYNNLKYNIF